MGARILALVRKEFLALFRDRKSRLTIIVPPIVQLLVFGYAATFDLNHVRFALFNEDGGGASRELAARFSGSPAFELAGNIASEAEIAPLIDSREVLAVLRIGPRCSAELAAGEECVLQVLIDGRNSNTAMLALNYVRSIVMEFNRSWVEDHGGLAMPARLAVRPWFNPNLESRWFFIPGIIALISMVVTLVVISLSVAREREDGTFDQLLVTPLRPFEVMIGKAVPGIVIGVGEASVIMLLAVAWFKIPLQGSLLTLYPALAIYILSIIGVGLMISSISATQQQALLGAFLFIVPAVILSGFSTPIANMPPLMQALTYLDPMRYFLIIVRRVFLEGVGIAYFWPQIWPMTVIAVVSLGAATWFFRHRMY